ncbi:MAG: NADP-dependent isocitrate dehydrogenase [Corynebacterium sp.]|nr:NADP-dependent isocitrate dehydrogenase [Corynebacterium sp.]
MSKIIYTRTDEAPLLATYSLKPIVEAFARTAGIDVETRDISLAGRILAQFPEVTGAPDALAELGALAKTPEANIIKLPNISASVPQLKAAIAELQSQGIHIPDYPETPHTEEEKDVRARYDAVKGSAVNPVLREGNSDRRAPVAVKNFAKAHPHRMGAWTADSKTSVGTMTEGDFRHNEKSVIMDTADKLSIVHIDPSGKETPLRPELPVLEGEVIDATVMEYAKLQAFLTEQIAKAKAEGVLFSVHLKATMMKVSDPYIFGIVVRTFLAQAFEEAKAQGLTDNFHAENGFGAMLDSLADNPEGEKWRELFNKALAEGPGLAMVNSDKGITNLHVPSDVIVDASMPAMIRIGGHMWNAEGKEQDTLAVIPDSSYAGVYEAVIEDCKANGAFDPATMGTVPNVGLMAQKAEEYGSHDKTFVVEDGRVEVRNSAGEVLLSHEVHQGDIWRACQTKDAPIHNWVKLAVERSRISGMPAVFWLDPERAHDRNIRTLVERYLEQEDIDDLDIRILSPVEAAKLSVERIRRGEDTISVTGNVLRDYLTDLFPILELGTSAKMLSVVPLMAGGGLFETGAGGSAPKHVQQVLEENHLRWDSLGEFLALGESLRATKEEKAIVLADALDRATERLLNEGKSPSRKVGEIDNRGSHFFLAKFWANELAEQVVDADLSEIFGRVASQLETESAMIEKEMVECQGSPVDLGGYYSPDDKKAEAVMRPSARFNAIIDSL